MEPADPGARTVNGADRDLYLDREGSLLIPSMFCTRAIRGAFPCLLSAVGSAGIPDSARETVNGPHGDKSERSGAQATSTG